MRAVPACRDDESVNVVVESSLGSTMKLKFQPDYDCFELSRPLPSGLIYPHDWGFVPATRAADGDPLDAFIAWTDATPTGTVVQCRLIGALNVEQNSRSSGGRERNDRLVAVPIKAVAMDGVATVLDLPGRWRDEIERFFLASVAFEGKDLKLLGWSGPAVAEALLRRSMI